LRRIFERKREEGWRRLNNEELHNVYDPPNIIKEIKSSGMRWAGLVACIEI